MFVLICSIIIGCDSYVASDISSYGKYKGVLFYDYLSSFPSNELIADSYVEQYVYQYKEGLLDDEQAIYLVCSYSQDDFEFEIERLEKSNAKYDADLFDFPSYIFVYSFGDCYEYAVVDYESNRIYYSYIQGLNGICSEIPYRFRPSGTDKLEYSAYADPALITANGDN